MLQLVKPALNSGVYIKAQCHVSFVHSLSLNTAAGRSKRFHAWFTSKYLYSDWLKAIPVLGFIIVGREVSAEIQEL